jgi:hypothetical protein
MKTQNASRVKVRKPTPMTEAQIEAAAQAAPDATAKAYIRAIAGDPAGVLRALSAVPPVHAAA